MVSRYKYLWWCWHVLMLYWKKVEFRPIDPIPRVWGGRRGGRRGESQQFSVMLGHPTLYWASLPYFPTDHKSPNHQESMLGFVENCFFFFQFIRDVLRFSYEIDKKQLRIFMGFVWIRSECQFTTMYNNLLIS